MALSITPVPILSDNYAWLAKDAATGMLAIVDPAEEAPVMAAIEAAEAQGGKLALILLTHHHDDHIAAADAIRSRTSASIVGARADQRRLPRLDQSVGEGDIVTLGGSLSSVMETPGHTRGHIAFFFAETPALFCGDTLFSLGCGRLLEGSAAEMYDSLHRIAALPDATQICCGHEYTASNARFAQAAFPHNQQVADRSAVVSATRAEGRPTVPSELGLERATNPFLLAADLSEFTRLRSWKDRFQ